jgi:hypothetical protein
MARIHCHANAAFDPMKIFTNNIALFGKLSSLLICVHSHKLKLGLHATPILLLVLSYIA